MSARGWWVLGAAVWTPIALQLHVFTAEHWTLFEGRLMSALGVASVILLLGAFCEAWPRGVVFGLGLAVVAILGAAFSSTLAYRGGYGLSQFVMVLLWVDCACAAPSRSYELACARIMATITAIGWIAFFLIPNARDLSAWAVSDPSITARYYGHGWLEAAATLAVFAALATAWALRRAR